MAPNPCQQTPSATLCFSFCATFSWSVRGGRGQRANHTQSCELRHCLLDTKREKEKPPKHFKEHQAQSALICSGTTTSRARCRLCRQSEKTVGDVGCSTQIQCVCTPVCLAASISLILLSITLMVQTSSLELEQPNSVRLSASCTNALQRRLFSC